MVRLCWNFLAAAGDDKSTPGRRARLGVRSSAVLSSIYCTAAGRFYCDTAIVSYRQGGCHIVFPQSERLLHNADLRFLDQNHMVGSGATARTTINTALPLSNYRARRCVERQREQTRVVGTHPSPVL